MLNIFKAFGIVFFVSLLLFGILKLLGLANADNAKLALTPFAAITLVYGKLDESAKLRKEHGKLETFTEFTFPFWKVFLLAAISVIAVLEFISGAGTALAIALVARFARVSGMDTLRLVSVATLPINLYALFAVGRWVGIRARTHSILCAALAGALCKPLDFAFSWFEMTPADYRTFYGFEKSNVLFILGANAFGIFMFAVPSILGASLGRRRRQAWYLHHLLKSIAPGARSTILDLAHEEAQKTLSPSPAAASPRTPYLQSE